MAYSIGEVASATKIAISTLRYYDREGLFPELARTEGGIRMFSDKEVSALRVIECLKASGMPIRDIKIFLDWCQEGDASIEKRRNMFYERLDEVEKQLEALTQTRNYIKFKCWYYDTAAAANTEAAVKNLPEEKIPEEVRRYRL